MFVRDIVERPTAKPSDPSAPPQPPRPPVASSRGFPAVAHRSAGGGSAFARKRKEAATRAAGGLVTGEGRIVDTVPSVQPVEPVPAQPASADVSGLSEAEQVRSSVDAEHARRVAGMSDAERVQEAEELKERFGTGVVDLMRKLRDAREGKAKAAAAAAPAPPPIKYATTADITDAHKILASVSAENTAKVANMSDAQVGQEVLELEERFGAGLLGKLTARAAGRQPKAEVPKPEAQVESMDVGPPVKFDLPAQVAEKPVASVTKSVRFDVEETTPSDLKKYFADTPTEDSKLKWMQAGSSAPPTINSEADTPRFDLSGTALTPEAAAALPTHLGLHHHGDQPDLAGYTLAEIVHLCYSTVASQRITMMGVLGRIITRYVATVPAALASDDPLWVRQCRAEDVVAKGVDVACGVLGGHTRSVGILVAAVDLLFTALGGRDWDWMDATSDDADADALPLAFHPEPTREGEPTGIASVPFSELAPRLSEILALDPGALPPTTFAQLLRIIQRAMLAAPAGAEAIAPLLPPLLRTQVLRAPWPADASRPPNAAVLRLVRDAVISSRAAAEALIAQNVFEPLLKFVTAPDEADARARALLLEVLRIVYALGRYGLLAGIATSARDIWQPLGNWVAAQLETSNSDAQDVVSAYFDLIRIWTVCAVDPHRTTPEHALTWAQATAQQWADEEIAAVRALAGTARYRELAAALGALAEYVAGAAVNGARKGEAEKNAVLTALGEVKLENISLDDSAQGLGAAVSQILRLHILLLPGELLPAPALERLVKWAQSSTAPVDVHLQHAALAAIPDGNTPQWASAAFSLVQACGQGDEPLALSLVDDLLRADWSTIPGANAAVTAIEHKDGLEILRPLLHHAVLPAIENVLGPRRPAFLYLKATGTLRPAPPRSASSSTIGAAAGSSAGLPLPPDWAFSPLDELLASGSSPAFALAPSDWDAGETQLTRATLALAHIQAAVTQHPPSRSLRVLNAMKVFMLEHGQQDAPNTEQDVFRDAGVQAGLRALLGSMGEAQTPPEVARALTAAAKESGEEALLEAASRGFLSAGVPFFQFYTDLLALYEAVSFGDAQFARVLLAPLAMSYPEDYRRLVWAEQPGSLRSIRISVADVPLETSMDAFYIPLETNRDVLLGQARAITGHAAVQAATSPFLFDLAVHHLAGLFFTTDATERTSVRVQLIVVVLSAGQDNVLRSIVQHDLATRGTVSGDERKRRVQLMGELAGPRAVQRLASAGL